MSSAKGPDSPQRVQLPLMRQRWETLTFLHWEYPVEAVQRLLPAGLEVEPWQGRAWVGLIPFYMRVRLPVGPAVPGLTTFPETNVRTYVVGPTGQTGVWFFSLDAANPPAVAVARLAYGLPYYPSRMKVSRHGGAVTYRSTRLAGGPQDVGHEIEVVPKGRIAHTELGELDHYLTARFRLWSVNRGLIMMSEAEHPPWPLQRAEVTGLKENLVQRVGLPSPIKDPIVHYSEGVDVRIGRPRLCGSSRSLRAHPPGMKGTSKGSQKPQKERRDPGRSQGSEGPGRAVIP